MVMRQVVNLRTRIPVQLGSKEAEREYEIEVADARRAQRVRYAVAPRARLPLSGGMVLTAGTEVTLAALEGATFMIAGKKVAKPAWQALRDAIEDGVVLEAEGFDGPPRAA